MLDTRYVLCQKRSPFVGLISQVGLAVVLEEQYYIWFAQFAKSAHKRHGSTLALLCHLLSIQGGVKI